MQKKRWGSGFLFFALLVAGVVAGMPSLLPSASNVFFYHRILPFAGIASALACFAVAHFSYPRVHNLKVYIGGFLAGLAGVAYFGLHVLAGSAGETGTHPGFIRALYAVIFANGIAIPLIPSYVKYRATRQLTFAVLILEGAALLWLRFSPDAHRLTDLLMPGAGIDLFPWIALLWCVAVTLLTMRQMASEFYLGGMLAGCALIYTAALITPVFIGTDAYAEPLALCLANIFFIAGIIIHSFARMEHRVAYDPLLHIYNREYCTRILAEQSSVNCAPPCAIAMVDIDHFKSVNDTHGHQAGDLVLHAVAQTVSREIVPDGILCRYGGEELAIFFPQSTAADVKPLLEQVRLAVEKTKVHTGKKNISVTISCGISHRSDRQQPLADVVAAADKAMYRAKEGGRNQVRIATTPASNQENDRKSDRVTRTTKAVKPQERRSTPRPKKD